RYLSEMMNFPGVLAKDPEILEKIRITHEAGKPVDGHAPGLRGDALQQYIDAGISTDHESFTREEALDKLQRGMKILIREGSAARNFEALIDLLHDHPDKIMFCSDDKHPDSLARGHINELCARAAAKSINIFNILQAACVNPVLHYGLGVGLLRKNDPADFIVVDNLLHFKTLQTYINGELVAENGASLISGGKMAVINNFSCKKKKAADFLCSASDLLTDGQLPVIEALDGQLITARLMLEPTVQNGALQSDTSKDILKIAVVNRYREAPPAIAFIKNFGLCEGAIASSVAHDSHNIIAVGTDDESLCAAINLVIENLGGISCISGSGNDVLALPIAGLMSHEDGYQVAAAYTRMDKMAKSLGSPLSAPFMTLSFMALLVIPSLKLSDRGLFDGNQFQFVFQDLQHS
ncbi:MAG: adenine deaminase C-terminal domain-containing protein, partial [Flavitalea sp.]